MPSHEDAPGTSPSTPQLVSLVEALARQVSTGRGDTAQLALWARELAARPIFARCRPFRSTESEDPAIALAHRVVTEGKGVLEVTAKEVRHAFAGRRYRWHEVGLGALPVEPPADDDQTVLLYDVLAPGIGWLLNTIAAGQDTRPVIARLATPPSER
ncbi:hypothetical protein K7472_31175 [Streptomyces sp. PTM05]|uniref:Uncharacterized protein n=1 Tax=Streptantibioticus parmotrematis TaxID=2873249 RepID=A0ABS7R1D2_9ACTN|nr:hypothetical protein [Streptantibioticus parmotrematis]MBY8889272.1 hypothetical protein [Streptantibioticus parmotrematis]